MKKDSADQNCTASISGVGFTPLGEPSDFTCGGIDCKASAFRKTTLDDTEPFDCKDRISLTGFTVIEILTVVSIISILCVLLAPLVSSARGYAKTAVCTTNLKQVGTCFNLYTNDYNGTYPHEDNGESRPPFNSGWYLVLKPYVNEDEIFLCPAVKNYPEYYSYKMNSKLETERRPFFRIRNALQSSTTVLVFDGRIDNVGVRKAPKGTWNMISNRHKGKANILFLDNHVELVERECDRAGWADDGGLNWEAD